MKNLLLGLLALASVSSFAQDMTLEFAKKNMNRLDRSRNVKACFPDEICMKTLKDEGFDFYSARHLFYISEDETTLYLSFRNEKVAIANVTEKKEIEKFNEYTEEHYTNLKYNIKFYDGISLDLKNDFYRSRQRHGDDLGHVSKEGFRNHKLDIQISVGDDLYSIKSKYSSIIVDWTTDDEFLAVSTNITSYFKNNLDEDPRVLRPKNRKCIPIRGYYLYTDNWTRLISAAFGNNTRKVKKFIRKGDDVNHTTGGACEDFRSTREIKGTTALHFAARNGNLQMVKMLLAAGADVNAKDAEGATPILRVASYVSNFTNKEVQIYEALIEAGADLAVISRQETPLRPFSDERFVNNFRRGNYTVEEMPIYEQTPLIYVLQQNNCSAEGAALSEKVIQMLVDGGADVNQITPTNKVSALHVAAGGRHECSLEKVKSLLQNGADKRAVDFNDKSAIDWVYSHAYDYKELVTLLEL